MTLESVGLSPLLVYGSIASGVIALLSLLVLHVVSPEFQPSWRMVSEYALGEHRWLITTFFMSWGVSSLLLALVMWPIVESSWARAGVILLLVSGVGEILGGVFDVKHPGHGLAALLGVPTLPIAAVLLGHHLASLSGWADHRSVILLASHATWISLAIMAVAMIVMMMGFRQAGIPIGPDSPVPDRVPEGVVALAGYANRWLVLCYVAWLLLVGKQLLSVRY